MEHYLIIARSVTHAQRIERALSRAGIHASVFRAPMELTNGHGCAYAVQIGPSNLPESLKAIHGAGLSPVQIFLSDQNGYQEVIP